jgi:hypothetical protein
MAIVLSFPKGIVAAPTATQRLRWMLQDNRGVLVAADGSLDVTERITVHAEGDQIRRGIYRDFPTRYKDRYGNRVVVEFTPISVLRDGNAEPWFTERKPNGVRLNTGNDDLLPVPADYTYTLRYRTTRQLGFFADHDELYWNAIGTGWAFPIESGSVEVRLPRAVPVDAMRVEGFTGAQGSQALDYTASLPAPGHAHWQLTRPLSPQEGMAIVLSFPKGIVAAPTATQRLRWMLQDNRGVLVALAALLGMCLYAFRRWRAVGRDPSAGIVIARYEPPGDYSPAALRFIRKMGGDNRCVTSDLLSLAVAGCLRIDRDKGLLSDKWSLQRLHPSTPPTLSDSQRTLLSGLFKDGDKLELEKDNAALLQSAIGAQKKTLEDAYAGRMFQRNLGSVGIAALIGIGGVVLALLLSGGGGIPLIIAIGVLVAAALIAFAILVRAPTPEGRKLLDEIEGLKLYLGVAERDELAAMPGPGQPPKLDAERYQALLPYAVALEVEDAWTKKFTLAVGAAAAAAVTAGIAWYRGSGIGDLNQLSSAIGSSLSSQIASASTPPGSSSGSGGGGFSGGGGGGGGGGGR